MNFLFVHQNFPGQYLHAVRYLAQTGHNLVFLTQENRLRLERVRKVVYRPAPRPAGGHPYLGDLEAGLCNALAVAAACEGLRGEGFRPDLMIGHNGWGETLYLKEVWPEVPLLGYFEFYYHPRGSDVGCDPEFPAEPDDGKRLRLRNAINLLSLAACDWGQTPTEWQYRQYPERYRPQLSVLHEGVDTGRLYPDPTARIWLADGVSLSREDEVVTYSARNLEPYRGFHTLMRALPRVLRERPRAQIVIIGGDGVSYGRPPSRFASWREQMLAEVAGEIDPERVHFVGHLPYEQYVCVLQLSALHVYLTYPFVLSWSLIEAMSAGCLVLGSATPPVQEVIRDGENGYLVPFPDADALARRMLEILRDPAAHGHVRAAARDTAIRKYELNSICLPAYLALLKRLSGSRRPL
ncbi:MAG TPA: glycosyltransferase family 4 protein [Stellaceae bacterium]|nr:glycosyltransferase family 4 protein [Stellaceae bacterium]